MLKSEYFILEKLYNNCGIPVCVYDGEECLVHFPNKDEEAGLFQYDRMFLHEVCRVADAKQLPTIYVEEMKIFFGTYIDRKGYYHIWGPAALENLNQVQLTGYKHKHHILEKEYGILKSSHEILSNILTIAYFSYKGEAVEETEILLEWKDGEEKYAVGPADIEKLQLEKSEMNRIHNSIEYENKFVGIVESGDVDAMKKLMQVNSSDVEGIGVVAENALKQMEYLCVSSIMLVSRAAIRGGMNPEESHDLSDLYLRKLEKCKTVEELGMVGAKMELDYTERVRAARERRKGNIYVERCKDYIGVHLRQHFQIQELAEDIGVNRSYLSRVFTEQEGMSIRDYIARERCRHAANMLCYTDYSISIIAEYFCFATQSHFGKQFKKIYGMTPNEYRKKKRYIESYKHIDR